MKCPLLGCEGKLFCGFEFWFFGKRGTVRIKLCNDVRSVNDDDGAVEKFVDGDFAFGKAASELRRLDLENQVIPVQRIIAIHGPLLFD